MGIIGDFVGRKVGEASASKAKGAPSRLAGKMYGKAVGKATEKAISTVSKKVLATIDESNNEHLVIGSQEELLSRNPQNSKLILLPQESTLRILSDSEQKYRIEPAMFSHRMWCLYSEKIRKIASITEKREVLKRLLHQRAKPRTFVIRIGKERIGILSTIYSNGVRTGMTSFNDWRVEEQKIFVDGKCIASYQEVKTWTERKYILDFSKELNEIVILLVLFAMRKADYRK